MQRGGKDPRGRRQKAAVNATPSHIVLFAFGTVARLLHFPCYESLSATFIELLDFLRGQGPCQQHQFVEKTLKTAGISLVARFGIPIADLAARPKTSGKKRSGRMRGAERAAVLVIRHAVRAQIVGQAR